jgi:hypothetical protein
MFSSNFDKIQMNGGKLATRTCTVNTIVSRLARQMFNRGDGKVGVGMHNGGHEPHHTPKWAKVRKQTN